MITSVKIVVDDLIRYYTEKIIGCDRDIEDYYYGERTGNGYFADREACEISRELYAEFLVNLNKIRFVKQEEDDCEIEFRYMNRSKEAKKMNKELLKSLKNALIKKQRDQGFYINKLNSTIKCDQSIIEQNIELRDQYTQLYESLLPYENTQALLYELRKRKNDICHQITIAKREILDKRSDIRDVQSEMEMSARTISEIEKILEIT